jgi:23S rRNA U2552 (ribose-2'-O)-methylase RlmE/FtsJ
MYSSKLKKHLIYELSYNDKAGVYKEKKKIYKKNNQLNNQLNSHKNKIDDIYNNNPNLWDEIKKFSNEYEFIYTNNLDNFKNVSNIFPISRSYFKLWEILHDFELIEFTHNEPFVSCHLAEGPGGFIECIYKYIHKYITNDFNKIKIYGSTLISKDTSIPKWKIKKNIQEKFNIILNNSIDDNGDLYDINQVEIFINNVGKNTCDFLTADGGFDFSKNYNNQEKNFINLFISEIYIILNLLKDDGNAIIKIYDIYSKNSIKVLYIFSIFFDNIYIIKPLTSRPANSEKYILGNKFKKNKEFEFYLNILRNIIITKNLDILNNNNIIVKLDFIDKILNYNKWYTKRQISYINKTIEYINEYKKYNNRDYLNNIYNLNKKCCIEWCKIYNLIRL